MRSLVVDLAVAHLPELDQGGLVRLRLVAHRDLGERDVGGEPAQPAGARDVVHLRRDVRGARARREQQLADAQREVHRLVDLFGLGHRGPSLDPLGVGVRARVRRACSARRRRTATACSQPRSTRTSRCAIVSWIARILLNRSRSSSLCCRRVQVSRRATSTPMLAPLSTAAAVASSRSSWCVEQFVHPGVRRRRHRTVCREQLRVRQRAHDLQRREVVAQRRLRPHQLDTDRRRDVRKHVVAGEQDARLRVVEHHVPGGVAGRVDRAQRARLQAAGRCRPASQRSGYSQYVTSRSPCQPASSSAMSRRRRDACARCPDAPRSSGSRRGRPSRPRRPTPASR